MSTHTFESLCLGLCDIAQVPRIALDTGPQGSIAFHLKRKGVTVAVLHFPQACDDYAFLLFEFGAIPYDDPRAARIVLALLDCNFLVPDPWAPAFGRNPFTGDAAVRSVYPLAAASPVELLQKIDIGVDLALEWRRDYFLKQDAAGATDARPAPGLPAESHA